MKGFNKIKNIINSNKFSRNFDDVRFLLIIFSLSLLKLMLKKE